MNRNFAIPRKGASKNQTQKTASLRTFSATRRLARKVLLNLVPEAISEAQEWANQRTASTLLIHIESWIEETERRAGSCRESQTNVSRVGHAARRAVNEQDWNPALWAAAARLSAPRRRPLRLPPQRPPSERTKSNQTHARRDPKCSRDRRNQVDGSLRQRSEAAHLEGQTDMPRIY
jgi:hypothetical protein